MARRGSRPVRFYSLDPYTKVTGLCVLLSLAFGGCGSPKAMKNS